MCRCGTRGKNAEANQQCEAALTWATTKYRVSAEDVAKYGHYILLDRLMTDIGFGKGVKTTILCDMWFGVYTDDGERALAVEGDQLIDCLAMTAKWWNENAKEALSDD
jgi:hypothetical protein